MGDGNSLINLGDLSKPATVLIEKVSNAIGVLYEPRRIRKKAKAEVDAEKIKVIGNIELTEIQQRGIERMIHQETRSQENIESIITQAASELPPEANPSDLDEDWIVHFFDKCKNVSNQDVQTLWSKLLAGEATVPGTYSRRTIDIIAAMDKKDAELFTRFCQFTLMFHEPIPLVFNASDDIYTKNGITFTSLQHLDFIGLISFEAASSYITQGYGSKFVIYYFGQPMIVTFPKDNANSIQLGNVMFTQAGKELVKICGAKKNEEFYEYVAGHLRNQGLIL